MSIRIKRLHVTLLEMLLVLAVLSIIAAAMAYNINNAVIDQRFRTEVSRVVDELRLAQDLMLILETDVHIKFAKDEKEGGIRYWLELQTDLQENWQKEIHRPLKNLQAIRGLFFNDLASEGYDEGLIDVKFLSRGSVMSRGVMRLTTSSDENSPPGTLENFICLPGYPHPIFSSETTEADLTCESLEIPSMQDQQLTLSTVEKLPEKVKEQPKGEGQDSEENQLSASEINSAPLPTPRPQE